MDLEEVWRIREEEVYPKLFGPVGRGIFPLTQEMFERRFGQSDIDPRWLFLGVFEFPPTSDRNAWIYVTSGNSNPWDESPDAYDPDRESGAGVEFTFAVSEQGTGRSKRFGRCWPLTCCLARAGSQTADGCRYTIGYRCGRR